MARYRSRCIAIVRAAASSTAPPFAAASASAPLISNWVQGEDLVSYYESSPGFRRGFCRVCGSPVVNRPGPTYRLALTNPPVASQLGIPPGILDDDPGIHADCHVFVADKAPWFEITDDLPQHPDYPPSG